MLNRHGVPIGVVAILAGWLCAAPLAAQTSEAGAPQSMPELLRQMAPDYNATERLRAAEAIAGYGFHAVPSLLRLLDHPDYRTSTTACLALSRIGPAAALAVPRLTELAAKGIQPMCGDAMQALGRIGPAASPAVPVLVAQLSGEDGELQSIAVEALGRIGSAAATDVAQLLQGGSLPRRLAACSALQLMNAEGTAALPALVAACDQSDESLRDAIFLAMGNMGADAVGPLLGLLEHNEGSVRRRAAMGLGHIGPPAADALPVLCRALSDAEPEVRFWAAGAVGRIGWAARPAGEPILDVHSVELGSPVNDLLRACHDPDPDVRWQAAVSLERLLGPAPARQALAALSDDPHPAVRRWATAGTSRPQTRGGNRQGG